MNKRSNRHFVLMLAGAWLTLLVTGGWAHALFADCSHVVEAIPLPDLGPGTYMGATGGLYPNGLNTRPPQHQADGEEMAAMIQPLDESGVPDPVNGKIVLISIGVSNTSREFGGITANIDPQGILAFKPRADADPARNPHLVIVNGAHPGATADDWADPDNDAWDVLFDRLNGIGDERRQIGDESVQGVSPQQVQVAWIKDVSRGGKSGFPGFPEKVQDSMRSIAQNLQAKFPNIKIAYISSWTRHFTDDFNTYEVAFGVKWAIEDQINGDPDLNFKPEKGEVRSPYITWGPYLWAGTGVEPERTRSDFFVWLCPDTDRDFRHPSSAGVKKVADQLLAFFKTDPTATPWYLNHTLEGPPPQEITASATPAVGVAPLTVEFHATAFDPDSEIAEYVWTYDDGTFSTDQNPTKIFYAPGEYNVHLTIVDDAGNAVLRTIPVSVSSGGAGVAAHSETGLSASTTDDSRARAINASGPSVSSPILFLAGAAGSAEPSSGTWATKAPMPTPRNSLAGGVVNGKIYAIGGKNSLQGIVFDAVEEYDPATDTWTTKAPMPTGRRKLTASVVNNKIYAFTGLSRPGQTDSVAVEEYDPATNTWRPRAPIPIPRRLSASSAVNGKIYVIGGMIGGNRRFGGETLDVVEEYDPATDTWATKAPMPTARSSAVSGVVNGKIYVIGGSGSNAVEVYDPLSDTWETGLAPIPTRRSTPPTASVVNNKIYVIGGWADGGPTNIVEVYDPATDTWETDITPMPTARHSLMSGVVNGKIYAIGGQLVESGESDAVGEFDPAGVVTSVELIDDDVALEKITGGLSNYHS